VRVVGQVLSIDVPGWNSNRFWAKAPVKSLAELKGKTIATNSRNSVSDAAVQSSFCCGGARKLDFGKWLVSWGGFPLVAQYESDGSPASKLSFSGVFSYRAVPVPQERLSAQALRQGMDVMFPR